MKTWDDLSDSEVSNAILKIVSPSFEQISLSLKAKFDHENRIQQTGVLATKSFRIVKPDYCNNHADMWPIICDNGICLISPTKGRKSRLWSASWNEDGGKWSSGDIVFGDKNPLRAAAIVFLMINGVNP